MYMFVILCITLKSALATDVRVDYIAPVDPCRDSDRLCPAACKIHKLTGTYTCHFCYCDNPNNTLNWETTSTTTVPPTTHAPSLPPGHSYVNGIKYVELKNACVLTEGMCPMVCQMANVTRNGRKCETCRCPQSIQESSLFGKRSVDGNNWHRSHAMQKRCMPMMACPIFKCPAGQRFAVGPHGCHECRCVDDIKPTVPSVEISSTPPVDFNKHFFNTYCISDVSYCPSDCRVVDFRVGLWHCFHCSCANGQSYIALTNPCHTEGSTNVCSTACKVRYLTDPSDPTMQCDYCDCSTTDTVAYRNHIERRFLEPPMGHMAQQNGQMPQPNSQFRPKGGHQSVPCRPIESHCPLRGCEFEKDWRGCDMCQCRKQQNNGCPGFPTDCPLGCASLDHNYCPVCDYTLCTDKSTVTTTSAPPSRCPGFPTDCPLGCASLDHNYCPVCDYTLCTDKSSVTTTSAPPSTPSGTNCVYNPQECSHNCYVTKSTTNVCYHCSCTHNYVPASSIAIHYSQHCLDSLADCPRDCTQMNLAGCFICKCGDGYFSISDAKWHHKDLLNQQTNITQTPTTPNIHTPKSIYSTQQMTSLPSNVITTGTMTSAKPAATRKSTTKRPITQTVKTVATTTTTAKVMTTRKPTTKKMITSTTAAKSATTNTATKIQTNKTLAGSSPATRTTTKKATTGTSTTTSVTSNTPTTTVTKASFTSNTQAVVSKQEASTPSIESTTGAVLATTTFTNTNTISGIQTNPTNVVSGGTLNQCYSCSSFKCGGTDLTSCSSGENYCMNIITQGDSGQRNFTKRCATEQDCNNGFNNNKECWEMKNEDKGPEKQPMNCTFCCTGIGCNQEGVILDALHSTVRVHTPAPFIIGKRETRG